MYQNTEPYEARNIVWLLAWSALLVLILFFDRIDETVKDKSKIHLFFPYLVGVRQDEMVSTILSKRGSRRNEISGF